jgi:hypothetical protein
LFGSGAAEEQDGGERALLDASETLNAAGGITIARDVAFRGKRAQQFIRAGVRG